VGGGGDVPTNVVSMTVSGTTVRWDFFFVSEIVVEM
jgi:hypothetical protein